MNRSGFRALVLFLTLTLAMGVIPNTRAAYQPAPQPIRGNLIESSNFGYSLIVNAANWEITDQSPGDGSDQFFLENPSSRVWINGFDYQGTANDCIETAVSFYAAEENVQAIAYESSFSWVPGGSTATIQSLMADSAGNQVLVSKEIWCSIDESSTTAVRIIHETRADSISSLGTLVSTIASTLTFASPGWHNASRSSNGLLELDARSGLVTPPTGNSSLYQLDVVVTIKNVDAFESVMDLGLLLVNTAVAPSAMRWAETNVPLNGSQVLIPAGVTASVTVTFLIPPGALITSICYRIGQECVAFGQIAADTYGSVYGGGGGVRPRIHP